MASGESALTSTPANHVVKQEPRNTRLARNVGIKATKKRVQAHVTYAIVMASIMLGRSGFAFVDVLTIPISLLTVLLAYEYAYVRRRRRFPKIVLLRSFRRSEPEIDFSELSRRLNAYGATDGLLSDAELSELSEVGGSCLVVPRKYSLESYCDQHQWREEVRRMVKQARVVVADVTEMHDGLRWELETIEKENAQERTILISAGSTDNFTVLPECAASLSVDPQRFAGLAELDRWVVGILAGRSSPATRSAVIGVVWSSTLAAFGRFILMMVAMAALCSGIKMLVELSSLV